MASPREVIEQIRKEKFGVGLPLDSLERIRLEKMIWPDWKAMLELVADELNTKDIHFVLELNRSTHK